MLAVIVGLLILIRDEVAAIRRGEKKPGSMDQLLYVIAFLFILGGLFSAYTTDSGRF